MSNQWTCNTGGHVRRAGGFNLKVMNDLREEADLHDNTKLYMTDTDLICFHSNHLYRWSAALSQWFSFYNQQLRQTSLLYHGVIQINVL